jgi:hypothetical protein
LNDDEKVRNGYRISDFLSFLITENLFADSRQFGAQVFFLFPAWKSVPDSRKGLFSMQEKIQEIYGKIPRWRM